MKNAKITALLTIVVLVSSVVARVPVSLGSCFRFALLLTFVTWWCNRL
jgi:hypothetical protein